MLGEYIVIHSVVYFGALSLQYNDKIFTFDICPEGEAWNFFLLKAGVDLDFLPPGKICGV